MSTALSIHKFKKVEPNKLEHNIARWAKEKTFLML